MIEGGPRVFTIESGIAFADALARGLSAEAGADPLALAAMTILLPTRRAGRALTDAFLRVNDGAALLLPRLLALADLDSDEDAIDAAEIPPVLDPLERQLILARLVMSRGGPFGVSPDQALRLGAALADLIDEVETEQADFVQLTELAPERFAGHWQQTLEFLKIVTTHWPEILRGQGAIDPAHRRVLALTRRAERWRRHPPPGPVIAAGFISADPALAALIAIVAKLPRGSVVLPGLDRDLDNESWDAIAETHPQFGLKRLIETIGIARGNVAPWPAVASADLAVAAPRVALLREALRPAETTEAWRSGPPIDPSALAGLIRVDCATAGEEAEVIALAMRHALETPGRTAALVTPDRALARRVAAALARWDIEVDDSAGRSLAETPVGIWLSLIAEAVAADFAPRNLLAMLKHPLASCGMQPEELRRLIRILERAVLRGPRPAPGLDSLRLLLIGVPAGEFPGTEADRQALAALLIDIAKLLDPLVASWSSGGALPELLGRHAEAAEAMAATPLEPGALRLWRGDDGEAAAGLLARLQGLGGDWLPPLSLDRFPAVLHELMATVTVRPAYGLHPRLSIWGLIEARQQRADLMILGSLNEGTWPPLPGEEPWMSPGMRKEFGLPPREARIGLAAQDFVLAAAGPNVLLTRALRIEGAPTVQARWLSRLDAVLAGSSLSLPAGPGRVWRGWAEALDDPGRYAPWPRPAPCPPLAARPRRLSVTRIETWMRDPYALYAHQILRLRALDALDSDPGAAERGQFVHHALDAFVKAFPASLPGDAREQLLAAGREAFGEALRYPSVAAFWWPRFERIADWFLGFEQERRQAGARPLATEIHGEIAFESGGRLFKLTAEADRIDRLPNGQLAIIDYKTGKPPTPAVITLGIAPQLPLEGVMARRGGFTGIAPGEIGELRFLQLSGGNPAGNSTNAVDDGLLNATIDAAWDGLLQLIAAFDDPATPYRSRPQPEFAYAGDYDHFARIEEWESAP